MRVMDKFFKSVPAAPTTAEQAYKRIEVIVNEQIEREKQSPYDWKVAVTAAWAAESHWKGVPVEGDAETYVAQVVQKLTELRERYYDADGEYTSGKGEIGSILNRIADEVL